MVCDGAMVASTVVSLMMNGMCCAYQQKEQQRQEEDQRAAIRRDIRTEYWHQRLIDIELAEQAEQDRADDERRYDSDTSRLQEDRRRRLLLDKMDASNNSRKQASASASIASIDGPPQSEAPEADVHYIPVSPLPLSVTAGGNDCFFDGNNNRRRSHLSPCVKSFDDTRRDKKLRTYSGSGTTSLIDEFSDDEHDDAELCSSLETLEL